MERLTRLNNKQSGKVNNTLNHVKHLHLIQAKPETGSKFQTVFKGFDDHICEPVPLHEMSVHLENEKSLYTVSAMAFNQSTLAVGFTNGYAQLYNPKTMELVMGRFLFMPDRPESTIHRIDSIKNRFLFIADNVVVATEFNNLELFEMFTSESKIVATSSGRMDFIIDAEGQIIRAPNSSLGEHITTKPEIYNLGKVDNIFEISAEYNESHPAPMLWLIQSGHYCTLTEIKYKSPSRRIRELRIWSRFCLMPDPGLQVQLQIYQNLLYFHQYPESGPKDNKVYCQQLSKGEETRISILVIELKNKIIKKIYVKNRFIVIMTEQINLLIYEVGTHRLLYNIIPPDEIQTVEVINNSLIMGAKGLIMSKPLHPFPQICNECYISNYEEDRDTVSLICPHSLPNEQWSAKQIETKFALNRFANRFV
jgi:hypothetical protein